MNHQERDALRLKRETGILDTLTTQGPEVIPVLARRLRDDPAAIRRESDRLCDEGRLEKRPIKYAPKYRRGTVIFFIPGDVRVEAAIATIVNQKEARPFKVNIGLGPRPKNAPPPPVPGAARRGAL